MSAPRGGHLPLLTYDIRTLPCSLKAAKSSLAAKEEQIIFRDCAEAFKAGLTTSGVYTLTFPNSTEEVKVRVRVPVPRSSASVAHSTPASAPMHSKHSNIHQCARSRRCLPGAVLSPGVGGAFPRVGGAFAQGWCFLPRGAVLSPG